LQFNDIQLLEEDEKGLSETQGGAEELSLLFGRRSFESGGGKSEERQVESHLTELKRTCG
jgi:hypothetical protein